MKSKMRKTLNVLYPDEFGRRLKKTKKQGFFVNRWDSLKLHLSELGKLKLFAGVMSVAGLAFFGYSVYAYNHFTAFTNDIYSAYANVEKESQRRNDLINNLVPPTLNYSLYEKELFSHVVEIRKELTSLNSVLKENSEDNSVIAGKLKTQLPALLGIFENYPDLKASKPFSDLMKELIETENRVAGARAVFNEKVNIYNTYIAKLPAAWVAQVLNYEPQQWFKASENAAIVPDMKQLDSVNAKPSRQ